VTTRLGLPGWQEDRPLPQQRHSTDIENAITQERLSSTYFPSLPSAPFVQDSQQSLAHPVVVPADLTQVTGRPLCLARGCGLDNSSSILEVAHSASHTLFRSGRVRGTTSWYCSSLSFNSETQPRAGSPPAPSRHMSAVSAVTAPLAKSSGHGLSGNKTPFSSGYQGKES